MKKNGIPYYDDFLSSSLKEHILKNSRPVDGIEHLYEAGNGGGLENKDSLGFLCELYEAVKNELNLVLDRRIRDRKFIDERTRALSVFNKELKRDYLDSDYQTVLGLEDGDGRIVIGPRSENYLNPGGKPVATLPEYLRGNHVTLFGPPDTAKLSINAMNAYHRKLKDEPKVVGDLLDKLPLTPKWGADDEDSKTPLREDLVAAGVNLTGCLKRTLVVDDGKKYELEKEKLSHPIKRFPGLALPCFFLFYKKNPVPLHLYDFALHFFENWQNKEALAFYVPKLENEEEARYIRIMLETAEKMIKHLHPEYELGSIRLMIVLENPRAVFRVHEILDELYPYFAGASLGWHDYLASTARLFKEDPNYRIPVKADPDIVIKYIKASHDLLAEVVGSRGGIKVGGMYGILPVSPDLMSDSYQVTIKGYIRDVITQMKRGLSGFWVAHPDFVRLGLALVSAWKLHSEGDPSKLEELVKSLLKEKFHKEVLDFIHGPDIKGLDKCDPLYARSLIVADLKESTYIANNHPDEVRYNVFQSLQYLTDWLSGNGCVALPANVGGVPVRVMDDLATAERSRWEVWHEIYHKRISIEQFLKIAHEEMLFIRKDLSDGKKIVQVKWNEHSAKWYPVAFRLMVKLMTDRNPAEFATQLLLPFTIDSVRASTDPWKSVKDMDPEKFGLDPYVDRFNYYFEMCGSLSFATSMASSAATDKSRVRSVVRSFTKQDILDAASFHGDIGAGKATLDIMASAEQSKVLSDEEQIKSELQVMGKQYLGKFGMKFLVSAAGKSGLELLKVLKERINNSHEQELDNARDALFEITKKRIETHPYNTLYTDLERAFRKHKINAAQLTIMTGEGHQNISFGAATDSTWFELASLSKSLGSAFAIEYFKKKGISLSSSVNKLFALTSSDFRLEDGDKVTLAHLMSHCALNLHYVNGVPANLKMPPIKDFLSGNKDYGYEPVRVINPPGEVFQYSGGGFLVLEHLIEALENKSIFELTRPFLNSMDLNELSFEQHDLPNIKYAHGFKDSGEEVEGTRKVFPAFAAGAMGTSAATAKFLMELEKSYHSKDSPGPLSHDTACLMLHGTDKGCHKFMGVKMGLGIFIGEAGPNKLAIHQGANDGFRCIFLHCFAGPDRGKGLVVFSNADLKGILFNAEVTQIILKALEIEGIDFKKFKSEFTSDSIPQEHVVNMGYKNLVFDAFVSPLPEAIIDPGPKDPLAPYNVAALGKILEVSDERFARAENLLSDHLPKFDPELFGKQGKIMDSWETVRHNLAGMDTLVFSLKNPAVVRYVLLSTKYHFGNHSPFVRLEGLQNGQWIELLPKTPIDGHSEKRVKLEEDHGTITQVRVSMYPDGGFSRLGLYDEIPDKEKVRFLPLSSAISVPYAEKIPHTKKPLTLKYVPNGSEIKKNLSKLRPGEEFDNASLALGARLISASNEHYGPAIQVLSPFAPINMFDGLESARSRKPGSNEEVVVALAMPARIHRIEMDFTYFVNNNPLEVSVEGLSEGKWIELAGRTNVKAFAANVKTFEIINERVLEQVKVKTYPCGGMNRLKVYSKFRP